MAVSKKQQACVARYVKNHYDRFVLTMPKGRKEEIVARLEGKSLNSYICELIRNDLGLTPEEWRGAGEGAPEE